MISCKVVDLIPLGTSLVYFMHLPRVSRCRPLKEWIEREPNDIVITCHFFRSALQYISMTILPSCKANGLVLCCLAPLSTIFQLNWLSVIIVGRIRRRRTWRKSSTYRKSMTNFIRKCCTPRPDRDSNSQHQW
jgi:hypothetical protein